MAKFYSIKSCRLCRRPFKSIGSKARHCSLKCTYLAGMRKPDECWEWTKTTSHGYGQVKFESTRYLAHRVAWEITNGPIPEGLHVLHRCDNPLCCNPNHLWLGTQKDNVNDCIAKNRRYTGEHAGTNVGETNGTAKLTARDVFKIRASEDGGRALANRYGVSPAMICLIKSRKAWKHI